MRAGLLKALLIAGVAVGAGSLVGCDDEDWEDLLDQLQDVADEVDINVDVDDDHHEHHDDDSFWFDAGVW